MCPFNRRGCPDCLIYGDYATPDSLVKTPVYECIGSCEEMRERSGSHESSSPRPAEGM